MKSNSVFVRMAVGVGVLGGLVVGAGTACAAPGDDAGTASSSTRTVDPTVRAADTAPRAAAGDTARETIPCPGADCTVTAGPGDVIDFGTSTLTVTAVGDSTVTTTSDGSTITSGTGGTAIVNGLRYQITDISDGTATFAFSNPDA